MSKLGAAADVVDVDRREINNSRPGRTAFVEPGLPSRLVSDAPVGHLWFTSRYAQAQADVGYVIVCVPTPASPEGGLDPSFLRAAYLETPDEKPGHRLLALVGRRQHPEQKGSAVHAGFLRR